MRILWVATKAPWPPQDGGRLLADQTLRALAAAGHEIVLVAPAPPATGDPGGAGAMPPGVCEARLVPGRRIGLVEGWLRARLDRLPLSVARHRRPAVAAEVARRLASAPFDVVHCEQVQALPQCEAAARHGPPVVLRAQNVESDLWRGLARGGGLRGRLARWEAGRMAAYEGRAVRAVAATVALTEPDARRLRALAGGAGVVHRVAAPFVPRLPPGPPLPGDPAVAVLGGGWLPNRDATRWLVRQVWPAVRARCPGAALHLFGEPTWRAPGLVPHPPPADSRAGFPEGGLLLVPLRIGSGVRMKILEAWARGVAVVATPVAAAGLQVEDDEALRIAADPGQIATAVRSLRDDPAAAGLLIAAGRRRLRDHHAPERVARRLAEVYAAALARPPGEAGAPCPAGPTD